MFIIVLFKLMVYIKSISIIIDVSLNVSGFLIYLFAQSKYGITY